MRKFSANSVGLFTLALAMTVPAHAQAQDAEDGSADEDDNVIIVTAQKSEQNLQDVPIAVSVIGGEALENQFTASIENIQTLVPAISFRKGSTNANSAISIRGIGTVSFSLAAEPAVSTVIDGVVLGRSGQAFGDLYDIERLEVLRGPQGTLYGKNAQAGVVSIITRKPSDTLEGYVDVSLFEDDEYKFKSRISGPLTDNLKASLTASYATFDGHIRNTFYNRNVNGYDRWGVRAMVEYEPSSDLSLLFIAEHSEGNDDCCADLEVLPSGRNPASPAAPNSNGIVNGVADLDLDQRLVDHDLITQTLENRDAYSLEAYKEFEDGHSITSITAWRQWENTEIREGDFTSIGGSSTTPVFAVPFLLHDDGTRTWTQLSQELRFQSPQDQPLRYLFGLYYASLDVEADFTRNASCQNNGGQNQPILDANPGLTCNANDIVSATGFFDNSFDNYAAFGQLEYEATEGLNLLLGARVTRDELEFVYTRRNNDPFGRQGVGVRPAQPNSQFSAASGGFDNTFANSTANTDFSIKAGFSADLGQLFGDGGNVGSIHATYAQGYKGPGFNTFYNMGFNDALPIDAEDGDSFEVGYKINTSNLVFNIAAYYAKIRNFQANNFDNSTGVTITRLTNAGSVETKGIEVDASFKIADGLSLTASAALNDATIAEFNCPADPTTGVPPAGCTTRSGLDLFFSPDFNYTLGMNYETDISDSVGFFFNTSFAHIDDQNSLLPGTDGSFSPNSFLPSYNSWNANIGLSFNDDALRVTLIGKNLTDDSFVTTFSGDGFRYQIPRDADRYFGLNLRMNFGDY